MVPWVRAIMEPYRGTLGSIISANPHEVVLDYLEHNPDEIEWNLFAENVNPRAVPLLTQYVNRDHYDDNIWEYMGSNPNTVNLCRTQGHIWSSSEASRNPNAEDWLRQLADNPQWGSRLQNAIVHNIVNNPGSWVLRYLQSRPGIKEADVLVGVSKNPTPSIVEWLLSHPIWSQPVATTMAEQVPPRYDGTGPNSTDMVPELLQHMCSNPNPVVFQWILDHHPEALIDADNTEAILTNTGDMAMNWLTRRIVNGQMTPDELEVLSSEFSSLCANLSPLALDLVRILLQEQAQGPEQGPEQPYTYEITENVARKLGTNPHIFTQIQS